MTPDLHSSEPVSRRRSPVTPREPGGRDAGRASAALSDLSAATDHFDAGGGSPREPSRRRPRFLIMGGGALAVGLLVALLGPFSYNCVATFHILGNGPGDRVAMFRERLLDYAWRAMAATAASPGTPDGWFVDAPSPATLRLCISATDREAGVERVRVLARGYLADVAGELEAERKTPSDVEVVLSEYAAELEARLNDARADLKDAVGSLPAMNPREQREYLIQQWQSLRTTFLESRQRLADATAELERLRAEPEPTHGVVATEDREQALQADSALQQDLRELKVNLSELKLQLLKVWQESTADLERLSGAAGDLAMMVENAGELWNAAGRESAHESIPRSTRLYRELLRTMTSGWDREFAKLRQLAVDPLSGDILAIHQRLRSLLGDFLFSASKQLAVLRAGIMVIGADSEDRARLHVLESDVIRGFQNVQAAHRRFEFSTSVIDPHDNFRLDTALRGARGLRRRSLRRIESIDKALREQAARRARVQHAQAVAKAKEEVDHWRSVVGQAVEDIVYVQEKLNLNVDLSEEYLKSTLRAKLAERGIEAARADAARTTERLDGFATRRLSNLEGVGIELVECGVIGGPVNLGERLRLAGAAAAVTLLILGLGFRWMGK